MMRYADSHPSLNASMEEDFEARDFSPTFPDMPSTHSGFRSPNVSEYSESSRRSYSPPNWRKQGSGWFKHPSLSPHRRERERGSKEASPLYHDAEEEGDLDTTAHRFAARIPLPRSPSKGRSVRNTPEPAAGAGAGAQEGDGGGGDATLTNLPPEVESKLPQLLPVNESNCKYSP